MRRAMITLALALLPTLAQANGFEPVRDKDTFLSLIKGKALRIGLYNLTLNVQPDGKIKGSALGWDISGNWSWQDGYFCRDMEKIAARATVPRFVCAKILIQKYKFSLLSMAFESVPLWVL